ncbi:hypothetical protein V8E52_005150 [Russula decolorans]
MVISLQHPSYITVFSTIEPGTWDDTLEVFINWDGDPSQFASSPHFAIPLPAYFFNCAQPCPYSPQHFNACGSGSGGVQTKTFVVDFASVDDARWEALLEELKPIGVGVLVNNVGVPLSHEFPADFVVTSPEVLATIVNVNVTATLRVTSLIAPSMASRVSGRHMLTHRFRIASKKGPILNMGSFAGAPTPMLAVYSASKPFLRTWSEGLAAELASKGVIVEHVNTYYVVQSDAHRCSFPLQKLFAAMGLAPSKVVLAYTHALLKDTRRRALAKQAKLAKQE